MLSSNLSTDPHLVGILWGAAFPMLPDRAGYPPARACGQERGGGLQQQEALRHRPPCSFSRSTPPCSKLGRGFRDTCLMPQQEGSGCWQGKGLAGAGGGRPAAMPSPGAAPGDRRHRKAQSTKAAGGAISHLTPTTGCTVSEERNGNNGLHL